MNKHETTQMSFLEHLEELRWRLIKSIIAVLLGGMISFLFILSFLQLPSGFQNVEPFVLCLLLQFELKGIQHF